GANEPRRSPPSPVKIPPTTPDTEVRTPALVPAVRGPHGVIGLIVHRSHDRRHYVAYEKTVQVKRYPSAWRNQHREGRTGIDVETHFFGRCLSASSGRMDLMDSSRR